MAQKRRGAGRGLPAAAGRGASVRVPHSKCALLGVPPHLWRALEKSEGETWRWGREDHRAAVQTFRKGLDLQLRTHGNTGAQGKLWG